MKTLFNELKTAVSDASGNPRGGYVLISAGADRYYGTFHGKVDDLAQVGGE